MKNIYIPHLQDLGGSRTYRVFGMVDKLTLTLKHFKAAFLAPRQAWQLQEWHLSFKRGRRVRGWEARLLSADCSSCNPTSGFHSLPRIYRALKTTDFYRALFRPPRLDRCSDLYVINVMYRMDLVTKIGSDVSVKQARKLGRCDSYLRNLKTLLTDSLTHSIRRGDAIASKNY